MRVFVTGASGWIGSALVPELIAAGHEVTGLARSDSSARALLAAGAKAHRGSLEDLDSLRAGAEASDGVVHLAFIHDFDAYGEAMQTDQRAIETLGSALEGSDRPLAIASGLLGLAGERVATEEDVPDPASPRSAAAAMTLSLADRGVRSSVVRLPPTVHGAGDKGFVALMIAAAREKGVSGYVGQGSNNWSAVHRLDAARLFRLGLEDAPPGTVLHAAADVGVPTRAIAQRIGRHLGVPVASIPPEEAADHFGFLGLVLSLDASASSDRTRELLSWTPVHPGLLDDLDQGHYFG